MNLLEVLQSQKPASGQERIYGMVVGAVASIGEGELAGCVKLSFPWLMDDKNNESNWARVALPLAGANRGAWFMPRVGDEVLAAFLHGDINQPIVLGCLWNGKDRPPAIAEPEKIVIQYDEQTYISLDASGCIIQGKKVHFNPNS